MNMYKVVRDRTLPPRICNKIPLSAPQFCYISQCPFLLQNQGLSPTFESYFCK